MTHSIADIYGAGAPTWADDSSSWGPKASQHTLKWGDSGTFTASERRALITVPLTQGHKDGVSAITSKVNAYYLQLHST